ncbi:GNAT family N-acetyltransferase [Solicola gregarius]|uniref:GNAT family N-acetyltransferase n=2 Tax=Solicola gregarius TaxID=2908642 RepID=A0AA46TM36_9ACTN|nr:GNAT family N-acetyltransferase [Solicola gregarius]UYM07822.1 GNAT family N-acetyltransferase [Solicola gregarius]
MGWHEVHDGNVPDALVDARTRESFARRSADRVSDTVVAVVDGAVAGFVMVNDDEVDQVYVADNDRGTGIAAAVLTAGERRIAEQGYAAAWLAVVPSNARARRFYERQGWQDGGLFEHTAPGPTGPIAVVCHRYIRYLRQ